MNIELLERFDAGVHLPRDDVDGLRALIETQRAEIARLTGEVARLQGALSGRTAAAPVTKVPRNTTARDAAHGAAALAIAANQDRPGQTEDVPCGSDPSSITAADSAELPPVLLPQDIYCDRLTFIKGIDIDAAGLLAGLGVTRFADIAAFTPEDVSEINRMLGTPGRVSRQGWIEQAKILAAGRITLYACQIENGLPASRCRSGGAEVIELASVRGKVRAQKPRSAFVVAKRWGLAAASLALIASIAWQAAGEQWHDAVQKMASSLL